MRRLLTILMLACATLAHADCVSSVTAGPTMTRTSTHKVNYQRCHWESSDYNPTIDAVEANALWSQGSSGTLPGTCVAGVDMYTRTGATGDPTLFWCSATNTWTPVSFGGGSVTVDNITSADSNFEFFTPPRALKLIAVGCHCDANCGTQPTLTFANRGGTTIGLASSPLTCSSGTSNTSFTNFNSNQSMAQGQGVNFTVTNSPASSRINLVFIYN